MARSEHLPIYKASYDLCLYLEEAVHGFSRYHKYTLGAICATGRAGLGLAGVPSHRDYFPENGRPNGGWQFRRKTVSQTTTTLSMTTT